MDENTVENIRYKFELKKLTGDEALSSNAVISEIRSDPWVDDLEILSSAPNLELQEDKVDNNISYSVLYSKDTDGDDETKLIAENVDLYSDLVKIEEEERKAKQIHEAEFEDCKKELKKLKVSDAKNRARIEELTRENANLKKSISSLYRTVKNEIEFKDKSLAEANSQISRLESMIFQQDGPLLKNGKCLNCENISSDFKKDIITSKRKRSRSPESSKKRECKSNGKTHEAGLESELDKRKTEKKSEYKTVRDNHNSDSKDKKETQRISRNTKHDKEVQTSNQCVFCQYKNPGVTENSKSSEEINDIFFSLLPDSLKKSFHKYEENQVISLSKLKEAFVDEYFSSVGEAPSPILESTPKRQANPAEELTSNKSSTNKSSSSRTASTPTSGSEHHKRTELTRKSHRNECKKDSISNHVSKVVPRNCYNSRLHKKDLLSLFKYRKEKIPLVEKKKFEVRENSKNSISEKLL